MGKAAARGHVLGNESTATKDGSAKVLTYRFSEPFRN